MATTSAACGHHPVESVEKLRCAAGNHVANAKTINKSCFQVY